MASIATRRPLPRDHRAQHLTELPGAPGRERPGRLGDDRDDGQVRARQYLTERDDQTVVEPYFRGVLHLEPALPCARQDRCSTPAPAPRSVSESGSGRPKNAIEPVWPGRGPDDERAGLEALEVTVRGHQQDVRRGGREGLAELAVTIAEALDRVGRVYLGPGKQVGHVRAASKADEVPRARRPASGTGPSPRLKAPTLAESPRSALNQRLTRIVTPSLRPAERSLSRSPTAMHRRDQPGVQAEAGTDLRQGLPGTGRSSSRSRTSCRIAAARAPRARSRSRLCQLPVDNDRLAVDLDRAAAHRDVQVRRRFTVGEPVGPG